MEDGLLADASLGDQRVERVALVSVHTCPLEQPGSGDAGGMNVAIRSTARRLAEMGLAVDVFTRRAGAEQAIIETHPGVRVVHLDAGPPRRLDKAELPQYLSAFLCALLRFEVEEAARLRVEEPFYDVVHAHYWMSGWVGRLARERWGVPLIQTFHTLARVKDRAAAGDGESRVRAANEERLVHTADCVIAPTAREAAELVTLYGGHPERISVLPPGVESGVFTPGDREWARAGLGLADRPTILFVGRLQPLKQPDVAIRALAELLARDPALDPALVVIGGPSGHDGIGPSALERLAARLGVADRVQIRRPVPHERLAAWYRAADVVLVPSRTESFGLVALEAAACGTPVVASNAGGLRTAVCDGVTGVLVDASDPAAYAAALHPLLRDPAARRRMGGAGARYARRFDWRQAAAGLLGVYEEAAGRRAGRLDVAR